MKIQDFTAEKLSTVSHAFRPSSCINAWNVHLPHPFTPGNLWSCETVSSVAYEVRDADRWERWDEMGEAVSECAIQICVCFLRRKYVSTTAVLARKTFSATSKECALRALDSDRSNRKFSQCHSFLIGDFLHLFSCLMRYARLYRFVWHMLYSMRSVSHNCCLYTGHFAGVLVTCWIQTNGAL